MNKVKILVMFVFLLGAGQISLLPVEMAYAQIDPTETQALLDLYAPVLYFHPTELFRPQPVDVLVDNARLRQNRAFWFDTNILSNVAISDLFAYQDDSYFLDAWYGDEELSDSRNYSFHRFYYETVLQPEVSSLPIVTYGRIVSDEVTGNVILQYWLFYYYNDWFNKHEGDWELVQVVLDPQHEPLEVVLSQHHGGTRRVWQDTQIEDDTHPVAYVALGSHANYFWGDELYPNGQDVGNSRVEIMDRTGSFGRVIPQVIPIPEEKQVKSDPDSWQGSEWLLFAGNWGETAPIGDFGGPSGPTQKGQQWEQPYEWGIAQPLDTETWYANRLRIEALAGSNGDMQVALSSEESSQLEGVEQSTNLAILHRDPEPDEVIQATIDILSGTLDQVTVIWPDPENEQVWKYTFEEIADRDTGQAFLILTADQAPELLIDGVNQSFSPSKSESVQVSWDTPDFVWMVNLLPASDIARGVTLSLLAGLIPTLLFVGVIYWVDRFEKEPKRLLATVFLWGAIPTLIFSLLARLFIQLPSDAFSPAAIAALRTGVLIPLVEEILKGLVVLYILLRYRREFDDTLDGIIYGSMVGFGFAMSRNIVSFLGAFIVHGYAGLTTEALLTGAIYGLNQATYTAIFGAGLGHARLSKQHWIRRWVPLAAFLLAVTSHILHNLAVHSFSGRNAFAMILTLGGFIVLAVIIIWALQRQKIWMRMELKDDIPAHLYHVVLSTSGKAKAQWRALLAQGYQGWRETRRLHQLCAELAFKRMQARRFSDDSEFANEAEALRLEIETMID